LFTFLIDQETGEIKALFSKSREGKSAGEKGYSKSIVAKVAEKGEPLIISEIFGDDSISPSDSIRVHRIKSIALLARMAAFSMSIAPGERPSATAR